MAPKIKVEIFCTSNSHFLQRIYTGLRMLEQQAEVALSYRIYKGRLPEPTLESLSWEMNLLIRVNDSRLVLFDMNDNGEIWREDLERVDLCFKRSFSARKVGADLAYKKVFPFGLNYEIYERFPSWFSLRRIVLEDTPESALKSAVKTLGLFNIFSSRLYRLHIGNCQAEPDPSLTPCVIFMTRLWDPEKFTGINREIVKANNEMRVACIRKLRREFGERFTGGLDPAGYAYLPREFSDCVVDDVRLSSQGNYMRLLKRHPIAVSTAGLSNSTGYKFAEYMAFSRAVVSEKLQFEAPGLEAGRQYLEFTTADECVAAVSMLMGDEPLRRRMMEHSRAYYQQYLPPDVTMRRVLAAVMERI